MTSGGAVAFQKLLNKDRQRRRSSIVSVNVSELNEDPRGGLYDI